MERDGRYADHDGPGSERGVPGFRSITSGATVFGVDEAENRHAQHTLLDANVLHRVAGSLARDLESPFFNGIKVFWGGPAGQDDRGDPRQRGALRRGHGRRK